MRTQPPPPGFIKRTIIVRERPMLFHLVAFLLGLFVLPWLVNLVFIFGIGNLGNIGYDFNPLLARLVLDITILLILFITSFFGALGFLIGEGWFMYGLYLELSSATRG